MSVYAHIKATYAQHKISNTCHAIFKFLELSSCIPCANIEMAFCFFPFSYQGGGSDAIQLYNLELLESEHDMPKPVHTQVQPHKHTSQHPPTHQVGAFERSIRDCVE
jgi:hypothetical protein